MTFFLKSSKLEQNCTNRSFHYSPRSCFLRISSCAKGQLLFLHLLHLQTPLKTAIIILYIYIDFSFTAAERRYKKRPKIGNIKILEAYSSHVRSKKKAWLVMFARWVLLWVQPVQCEMMWPCWLCFLPSPSPLWHFTYSHFYPFCFYDWTFYDLLKWEKCTPKTALHLRWNKRCVFFWYFQKVFYTWWIFYLFCWWETKNRAYILLNLKLQFTLNIICLSQSVRKHPGIEPFFRAVGVESKVQGFRLQQSADSGGKWWV